VADKKEELFKQVDPDLKVVIIEVSDKEMFLYGKSYGRGGEIFYNLFGLHATDKVEEAAFEQGWARISLEAIYFNDILALTHQLDFIVEKLTSKP